MAFYLMIYMHFLIIAILTSVISFSGLALAQSPKGLLPMKAVWAIGRLRTDAEREQAVDFVADLGCNMLITNSATPEMVARAINETPRSSLPSSPIPTTTLKMPIRIAFKKCANSNTKSRTSSPDNPGSGCTERATAGNRSSYREPSSVSSIRNRRPNSRGGLSAPSTSPTGSPLTALALSTTTPVSVTTVKPFVKKRASKTPTCPT